MKSRHTDNKLQDKIERILEQRPEFRDSDSGLVTYLWYLEAREQCIELDKITGLDFLKALRSDNHFTNHESVVRARRKVQELRPALRGKKYRDRQHKENLVRNFYRSNSYE